MGYLGRSFKEHKTSPGEPETSLGWSLVPRLVLSALCLTKALSATQSMLQELLVKAEGCEGWDLI